MLSLCCGLQWTEKRNIQVARRCLLRSPQPLSCRLEFILRSAFPNGRSLHSRPSLPALIPLYARFNARSHDLSAPTPSPSPSPSISPPPLPSFLVPRSPPVLHSFRSVIVFLRSLVLALPFCPPCPRFPFSVFRLVIIAPRPGSRTLDPVPRPPSKYSMHGPFNPPDSRTAIDVLIIPSSSSSSLSPAQDLRARSCIP